jgi:metal-responsive CopG/Arc/MetJ family transcriptional regulator
MKKEKTVDINVRNIPEDLMAKFDIYVVKPSYPGGRSEAIRNLIHAEVLKRQGKDKFVKKR